jgi:ribosomal protein L27
MREVIRRLPVAAGQGENIAFGEVARHHPGRAQMGFTIGAGADRVVVKVTLGTLRFEDRGTVRVGAQAIVRQAPAG